MKGNVIDQTKARRVRYVTVELLPLRMLLLSLFLAAGVLLGYVFSGRLTSESLAQLLDYRDVFLLRTDDQPLAAMTAVRTLLCYFRAPLFAFLLGFASIGIALLPLLFAAQGFVLSFSLCAFSAALGKELFGTLFVLFGVRLLFVLPCTLALGSAALEKSRSLALLTLGGGKRVGPVVYGAAYWYRFFLCCVCLLTGAVLELWIARTVLP